MCGGSVLDGGEGGVRLQEVGDDLSTLHFQVVVAETASEKGVGLSMAIDAGPPPGCTEAACRAAIPSSVLAPRTSGICVTRGMVAVHHRCQEPRHNVVVVVNDDGGSDYAGSDDGGSDYAGSNYAGSDYAGSADAH